MLWIYIIIILIIVIVICGAFIYHDTHSFVVRNYEVKTDKLQKDYTFVLMADQHGYVFGKDNEKLVSAIDKIHPDAILSAGDVFNARRIKGKVHVESGMKLMSFLASRYPVFAANGNHEYKIKSYTSEYGNLYDRYKNTLVRAGVTYLENEAACFSDENIRIIGLEIDRKYFRKVVKTEMKPGYISSVLGNLNNEEKRRFNILIAHNPQYFPEYAQYGADLTVSGHVHGGIIRLPLLGGVISPAIALFPKYDGGKFEKDGKTMILSRGLGTHTIHVRLFNPCELVVIKVRGVKNVT